MNLILWFFCCCVYLVNGDVIERKYDEEAGKIYIKRINADIQVKTTESVLATWAYESNITDENLRNQLHVAAKLANYTKDIWKETIKYPWKSFKDADVRRQFQKFSVLGTAILSPKKYEKFNKIISEMQSTYGKARICNYHNRTDCNMQLEPELTEIFVKSRDPNELRYYWEQWRNVAGKPVRKLYKEYVDLSNEAAVLNNFSNNTEFWLRDYEAKDFKEQVEALWLQLKPLYLQLHAYVRRRLREKYGEKHVTKKGPIPAHLLGNMWAQSWGNIFDFTAPYPGKPSFDVTPNMVKQGYTPLRMFKLAEEFFTSLNLSPMPDTFWKNSILEKPKDGRDLICHASAWDFYDGKDFRIKQCTRVNMEDLNTVHHEMGHIQYFLQYKNQPLVYKEGTNPGFHEAVGDVMSLSVSTPKHLRKIGLLNVTQDDAESDINQLFTMALDKIAFLPFGYLMDQWRWSVFEGKISEKDYNCKWWQLREKYQGLSPSVVRSEADFDPGAKYHTVGNVPYIRYFVSFVIQFQFHRSLCIAAKQYDPNNPTAMPLHKCDIYQSKEAGALLKKMLQMGSSKPWPEAMEIMTGQRKMDARPLLEYFAALKVWLEKENKRTGEFIGWESSQRGCEEIEGTERAAPSTRAEGVFEDDSISYSYAELVRQDDNAFGVPDYLEEVKPSYRTSLHNENEFPTNHPVSNKNDDQFPNQVSDKLFDISEVKKILADSYDTSMQQNPPDGKNINDDDISKDKLLNVILHDLHQIRMHKANRMNMITDRKQLNTYSSGREKHRVKFKPKYNMKFDKKHEKEDTKDEGKPACAPGEGKIAKHKIMCPHTHNSDLELMWRAELAKVEAEQMLKSLNFSACDELISNLSESVSPQDQEPQSHVYLDESKKLSFIKAKPNYASFKQFDLIGVVPLSFDPESVNSKRNVKRDNTYLMLICKPIEQDEIKGEKQCVKKSFNEYHYKIRPPVIYNSVIITSDGKNEKPEEMRDHSSFSDRITPLRKRESKKKRPAGAFLRGQEGYNKNVKNRLFKTVNLRKVNIRNIVQYYRLTTPLFYDKM